MEDAPMTGLPFIVFSRTVSRGAVFFRQEPPSAVV
jgi:hypothetical protein